MSRLCPLTRRPVVESGTADGLPQHILAWSRSYCRPSRRFAHQPPTVNVPGSEDAAFVAAPRRNRPFSDNAIGSMQRGHSKRTIEKSVRDYPHQGPGDSQYLALSCSRVGSTNTPATAFQVGASLRRYKDPFSERRVHVLGKGDELSVFGESADVAVVVIVAIALFRGDASFAFDNNRISFSNKAPCCVAVLTGELGKERTKEFGAYSIFAAPRPRPRSLPADCPCEVIAHCVDKGLAIAKG